MDSPASFQGQEHNRVKQRKPTILCLVKLTDQYSLSVRSHPSPSAAKATLRDAQPQQPQHIDRGAAQAKQDNAFRTRQGPNPGRKSPTALLPARPARRPARHRPRRKECAHARGRPAEVALRSALLSEKRPRPLPKYEKRPRPGSLLDPSRGRRSSLLSEVDAPLLGSPTPPPRPHLDFRSRALRIRLELLGLRKHRNC